MAGSPPINPPVARSSGIGTSPIGAEIRVELPFDGTGTGTVTLPSGAFGERITRVEVHLSDENSSQKTHGDAMRCRMEARPAAREPVTVTADGATLDQAVSGAAKKLERLLDSTFGRLDDPRR